MPSPPRPLLEDRYSLTERIADFGLGENWLANDEKQRGRQVVVKLLRPADGLPDALQRHLRVLRPLRVDGVLAIVNQGLASGRPFIVHPVFAGASLGTMLDRARAADEALPPRLVEEVFDQVLVAVQRIHESPSPLLHLGIDPDCVLVRAVEGQPTEVKLIDVGLSRWADRDELAPERSARQLRSRAPEQFSEAPSALGVATDVFALGGLLREMVSLPPELGQTLAVAGIDRRRDDVPPVLYNVIRRACQTAAEQRFADVASFRSAVASAWKAPRSSTRSSLAPSPTAAGGPQPPSTPMSSPSPSPQSPIAVLAAIASARPAAPRPLDETIDTASNDPGSDASPMDQTITMGRKAPSTVEAMDQTLIAAPRFRAARPSPMAPSPTPPMSAEERLAGDSWVASADSRPALPAITPLPALHDGATTPAQRPPDARPSWVPFVLGGIVLFAVVFVGVFLATAR